jgi:hypothetical protein
MNDRCIKKSTEHTARASLSTRPSNTTTQDKHATWIAVTAQAIA